MGIRTILSFSILFLGFVNSLSCCRFSFFKGHDFYEVFFDQDLDMVDQVVLNLIVAFFFVNFVNFV